VCPSSDQAALDMPPPLLRVQRQRSGFLFDTLLPARIYLDHFLEPCIGTNRLGQRVLRHESAQARGRPNDFTKDQQVRFGSLADV